MKELSIEEKARNYDEAREKIAIRFGSNVADEIFSQFEMSEDERMRNAAINACKYMVDNFENSTKQYEDAIAWLEKQGEHDDFRNKIQIGDKVTRNEDGVLVNLSQLNRVAKKDEKQGEQKPADVRTTGYWLVEDTEQKPAWSEEDTEMLNMVMQSCEKCGNEYVVYWLKSLKDRIQPQSQWKPSDKQMELLREAQQALLGKDCHNRFVNFMYELKRLREE